MDQFSKHPLYRKHNLDSAMSTLWDFYKKHFVSLFIISLVMSLVVQYATTLVNFKDLQNTTDPMVMLEKIREMIVPILIISLINLLFTNILQYYILYNPVDSTNNIFVSAVKSLKYVIHYLIIMILLAFAGGIAIVLGLFVLIVGAFFAMLYIMTVYFFILPVLMVEGPNIANAISRTFRLVHKNFWPNIGWVAVFIIILIVISIIFSAVILLPFTAETKNPLFIILSAVVSALTLPLMPIFAGILYFNGKASEEQVNITIEPAPENDKVKIEDLYARPYSDDHPENPEKERREEGENG
jgi:hypothetical protein